MTAAGVPGADPHLIYQVNGLRIDAARLLVTDASNRHIPMSSGVFRTLLVLALVWPNYATKAHLARVVQGRRSFSFAHNGINQHIGRLRHMLPPNEFGRPIIDPIRGEGWVLNVPVTTAPRGEPMPWN